MTRITGQVHAFGRGLFHGNVSTISSGQTLRHRATCDATMKGSDCHVDEKQPSSSPRNSRAGREDRRLDAEGGQGTERLPGRCPRHQAGGRRRRDDGPGAGGGEAAAADEKTEFDVVLEGFGDKKIGVIKVVRRRPAWA